MPGGTRDGCAKSLGKLDRETLRVISHHLPPGRGHSKANHRQWDSYVGDGEAGRSASTAMGQAAVGRPTTLPTHYRCTLFSNGFFPNRTISGVQIRLMFFVRINLVC